MWRHGPAEEPHSYDPDDLTKDTNTPSIFEADEYAASRITKADETDGE